MRKKRGRRHWSTAEISTNDLIPMGRLPGTSKPIKRLKRGWLPIAHRMQPTAEEVQIMLKELLTFVTHEEFQAVTGRNPYPRDFTGVTRKHLLWVLWAIFLHPWKCRTAFDIITWGRFRVEPGKRRRTKGLPDLDAPNVEPQEDYSI